MKYIFWDLIEIGWCFLPVVAPASDQIPNFEDLFQKASQNQLYRMCNPEGLCGNRQALIWGWLNAQGIASGTVGIGCPDDNIVAHDQFSGQVFTYSSYHMAPIVRSNDSGPDNWIVFDVQFLEHPTNLTDYLRMTIQGRPYEKLKDGQSMPMHQDEPCRWVVYDEKWTADYLTGIPGYIVESRTQVEESNKKYCR